MKLTRRFKIEVSLHKIAEELWSKHQNYFIQKEFMIKTEKYYYKEIFKFYTLIYADLSQVPSDIIDTIKSYLKFLNFNELIYTLADLNEKEFEFHFINFKRIFEDIIHRSSRQEIEYTLGRDYWEKNYEKLKRIFDKLPLIETKKKEKYFFE
ncbi:MAG: hypothetical protein ACTSRG_22100 [Candidatus Helarchaeota archaeon]